MALQPQLSKRGNEKVKTFKYFFVACPDVKKEYVERERTQLVATLHKLQWILIMFS